MRIKNILDAKQMQGHNDEHRHAGANGDPHKSQHVAKAECMEGRVLDRSVQFCQKLVQSIQGSTTANNEL